MKFNDFKYERPDLEGSGKIITKLVEELKNESDVKKAISLIDQINSIIDKDNSMSQLAAIRNTIDTTDEFYDKEVDWFNENYPNFKEVMNNYQLVLNSHSLKEELKEYYGNEWFNQIEIGLKTFSPIIKEDLVKESKLETKSRIGDTITLN